ncbi:MAG: UvrD-helicase domain-containing protein, partial [Myxococcales bacterium]|nr:UvrD-helicase domain-containing protein [Myxococcales bacterium]
MLTVQGGITDLDLDAIRLTDAQREALAIDRHVVVSAGAGSGKTHTLSWRYVRLLLAHASAGGEDIESVVVLTFTEKAAEEMAERCRSRLAAVAEHARREGLEVAPRLDRLLDRFDRARISTFHAFCARLLAEHPEAAGGVLSVDILEPEEASALASGVADETLDGWVATHDPDLPLLLDTFGSRRALLAGLQAALQGGRDVERRLADHAADRVALTWPPEATDLLRGWLASTGLPTLAAVGKLASPGGSPFPARLRPLLGPLPEGPLALHARAVDVLGALLTPEGRVRTLTHPSVLGAKAAWRDPRRYAAAKQALATLQERCDDWPERFAEARRLPTAADERMLEAFVPFGRLVAQARGTLLEVHRSRQTLDFD